MFLLFICALCIHVSFIASLLSEPFALKHNIHLDGTTTHPTEKENMKGFWDVFFHDTDRVPRGLDYFSIYQAGYNFRHGDPIYYGVRQVDPGKGVQVVPYLSGFRYLPVYAYIFGVLISLLPVWTSYWFWILCIECLLIMNIYLIRLLKLNLRTYLLVSSLWLFYTPYYIEIHIGQQSMVTVTLLHLIGIFHLKNRSGLRDTCFIGSVLWKLNTLLHLPLYLKFKRWKTIVWLIGFICGLSVPYFLAYPDGFLEFKGYFHQVLVPTGPNSMGMWTFIDAVSKSLFPNVSDNRGIMYAWSLSILIISSLITLLPKRINFIHALCMWICVYFLTYQYVWEHHYVMLLPVFSLLVLIKPAPIWFVLWFFCAIPTPYYFFNEPAVKFLESLWAPITNISYHGIKIIPVLVLYILSAINTVRCSSEETASQANFKSFLKTGKFSHL